MSDTATSVSLSKGQNVSLSKHVGAGSGLTKVKIGLGWDVRVTAGAAYDLDAFAICLHDNDKAKGPDDLLLSWTGKSAGAGAITSSGDNTTGTGAGDDEVITVDLSMVPADVKTILIPVAIAAAKKNNQNFGDVTNAYVRVLNADTDVEMVKFDLSEDGGGLTTIVFGQLYRDASAAGEWKFKAIEQGFPNGMAALVEAYGIHVDDPAAYDEGR